jgi:hypothetical protein
MVRPFLRTTHSPQMPDQSSDFVRLRGPMDGMILAGRHASAALAGVFEQSCRIVP